MKTYKKILKIMSGLQTGVDEAGADVAIALGIEQSGYVPKGATNEKGKICASTYSYIETESRGYLERTLANILSSQATLIFSKGKPSSGTLRTIEFCKQQTKNYLYVDLNKYSPEDPKLHKAICNWLKKTEPEVLNIAGSRESKHPGIYKEVRFILLEVIMTYNRIKND